MLTKYGSAALLFSVLIACAPAYAESSSSQTADWNGLYAGVAVGMSKGTVDPAANSIANGYFITTDPGQVDPEGGKKLEETMVNGGVLVGMNRQYGNIVAGIEVDLTRSAFNEQYTSGNIAYITVPASTFNLTTKVTSDWLASVRPRLGYAHKDGLYFASAGPAMTRMNYDFYFADTAGPAFTRVTESAFKLGWSAGVGYEHKLADDWSLKAEYLYTRFTNIVKTSSQLSNAANDGFNHKVNYTLNNVRVALVKSF